MDTDVWSWHIPCQHSVAWQKLSECQTRPAQKSSHLQQSLHCHLQQYLKHFMTTKSLFSLELQTFNFTLVLFSFFSRELSNVAFLQCFDTVHRVTEKYLAHKNLCDLSQRSSFAARKREGGKKITKFNTYNNIQFHMRASNGGFTKPIQHNI